MLLLLASDRHAAFSAGSNAIRAISPTQCTAQLLTQPKKRRTNSLAFLGQFLNKSVQMVVRRESPAATTDHAILWHPNAT